MDCFNEATNIFRKHGSTEISRCWLSINLVLQGVLTTLQFLQHTGTMLKNTWQHLEISVETCCNMWLNTFGGSIRSMRRRKRQDIKPYLFISYHIFYVHPWDISSISWRGGYQKRYQGGLRELKRRSKIFFDLLLF